jgi:hypothetical protein
MSFRATRVGPTKRISGEPIMLLERTTRSDRPWRRRVNAAGRGGGMAVTALLTGVVALAGCRSQDPVGVKLTLEESGSGTIAVSALSVPAIAEIAEGESTGVSWQNAARLTLITGTFANLDDVRMEDVEVDAAGFSPTSGTLRIEFPRGPKARWFRVLHVGVDQRGSLERSLTKAVATAELHENVTIAVEVPGARVAGGLVDPVPRISVTSKDGITTMVAPLEVLEEDGPPMVLVVNWERTSPGK